MSCADRCDLGTKILDLSKPRASTDEYVLVVEAEVVGRGRCYREIGFHERRRRRYC